MPQAGFAGTLPNRTVPRPSRLLIAFSAAITRALPACAAGANRSAVTSPRWLKSISRIEHFKYAKPGR